MLGKISLIQVNKFKAKYYDLIVLGAGIVGLSIARQKFLNEPDCKILIIEKESTVGMHASGRNSGVLHSGIYYPSDTLKAKLCSDGSKLMSDYCREHGLPIVECGKVILPSNYEDEKQIRVLYDRGVSNGALVKVISKDELKEIEPEANSNINKALYSPKTSVVDPFSILNKIRLDLIKSGADICYNEFVIQADSDRSLIKTNKKSIFSYSHLVNCTGQYSDKVAQLFDVGSQYTLLPFKGFYYGLRRQSNIKFNGLIYPVPDLKMPFLGVHSVKSTNGEIYFGPTAMPAFGRENYKGIEGVSFNDSISISYHLIRQYINNKQGFRNYANQEAAMLIKSNFLNNIQNLIPNLSNEDLILSSKVGIRAQLLNKKTDKLEMDFLVESVDNTTHILNAVSPAFTSAFSFAKYILNK
jgi:(S)-2-hydroxyglutarate dehydrogenase